jgi:hypothetical protein
MSENNLGRYIIKIELLISYQEIDISTIKKHLEDKLRAIEGIYYHNIIIY